VPRARRSKSTSTTISTSAATCSASPRWGGDDGPDDAAENMLNWTMPLGDRRVGARLSSYIEKGWEGHLRQYTEATDRRGSLCSRRDVLQRVFRSASTGFITAEGLSAFFLEGASSTPATEISFQTDLRRFAGFYMDEDPQAPNYDPDRRLIRSMFNGSRGPPSPKRRLPSTGPAIRSKSRDGSSRSITRGSYAEMLEHFQGLQTTVVGGQTRSTLGAGTLGFQTPTPLTGEAKYRDWLLGYVDGLARADGGEQWHFSRTNIGLDGTIGGACDGKMVWRCVRLGL